MKCDLIIEDLQAFLDDELQSNRRSEIEAHLQDCNDCTKMIDDLGDVSIMLRNWDIPTPSLPTGRELLEQAKPARSTVLNPFRRLIDLLFTYKGPVFATMTAVVVVVIYLGTANRFSSISTSAPSAEQKYAPQPATAPVSVAPESNVATSGQADTSVLSKQENKEVAQSVETERNKAKDSQSRANAPADDGVAGGVEGGVPGGVIGGVSGGIVSPQNSVSPAAPPPPPPTAEPKPATTFGGRKDNVAEEIMPRPVENEPAKVVAQKPSQSRFADETAVLDAKEDAPKRELGERKQKSNASDQEDHSIAASSTNQRAGSALGVAARPAPAPAPESARKSQAADSRSSKKRTESQDKAAEADGRLTIKTASMTVEPAYFDEAKNRAIELINAQGGSVEKPNISNQSGTRVARFTIKVPVEKLSSVLAELRKLGKVVEDSSNSTDVTARYQELNQLMASSNTKTGTDRLDRDSSAKNESGKTDSGRRQRSSYEEEFNRLQKSIQLATITFSVKERTESK